MLYSFLTKRFDITPARHVCTRSAASGRFLLRDAGTVTDCRLPSTGCLGAGGLTRNESRAKGRSTAVALTAAALRDG